METEFGQIIKEALIINDMTQKQLAKKLNISAQTLNSLIHGRSSLKIEDFFKILTILHLDPNKILCGNQQQKTLDAYLSSVINKLDAEQQQVIFTMLDYFRRINIGK